MKRNTALALRGRLLILATLLTGSAFAAEDAGDESRVSESSYFADTGRAQTQPNRVSTDEYTASINDNSLDDRKGSTRAQKAGATAESSQAVNVDFWVYDADVQVFADNDRDGFYHGIDLLFDVDTVYSIADVYAVVYLSLEGGPWVEYAETEDFTILGTSGTDEYVIVTELLTGYPSGSYDLLIEIFDADTNVFVADFGPESTSELSFLPLEDAERDAFGTAPQPPVAVSRGGGGAASWLGLAVLGLFAAGAGALRRQRLPRL